MGLAYAGLLSSGEDAGPLATCVARAHPHVRRMAGGVSILVGLHDTLVYWLR
jgi:hypothetical protein